MDLDFPVLLNDQLLFLGVLLCAELFVALDLNLHSLRLVFVLLVPFTECLVIVLQLFELLLDQVVVLKFEIG